MNFFIHEKFVAYIYKMLRTYEALEKRFTKNFMAEDKYFQEIKSRKFEHLPENGFEYLTRINFHYAIVFIGSFFFCFWYFD